MAKGKSFLGMKRGQAAGLVYSVGVDGNGRKQQVVRGLAESVANPQSDSQASTRSILAGAAVLASHLRVFSDHAVQGYASALAGRAQFVKMVVSPATDGVFGMGKPYVYKGSKAVLWNFGTYVQISKGTLPSEQELVASGAAEWKPVAFNGNVTAENIAVWGLKENDIFTAVIPVNNAEGALVGATTIQYRLRAGAPVAANFGVYELFTSPDSGEGVSMGIFTVRYTTGVTIHERVENGVKMRSNAYIQSTYASGAPNPPAAVVSSYQSAVAQGAWMPRDTYLDGSDL